MLPYRERLTKVFQQEYEKLNPQQQQAVSHIDGPVMVIAGPGTGKTQMLALRVGKILLDTDSLPENILCLTFTDAGAIAMRKRLQKFIGPDAYKVNIYTFHSFCNEIIQDNLSLFEKNTLDPISDLERVDLLRKLIDTFPKNHALKRYRGDVYFESKNLATLFSTIKRENWSADFLKAHIKAYRKEIEEGDEHIYKTSRAGKWQAGDRKPSYNDAVERVDKLEAAIDSFSTYQQLMSSRKLYDFDDMITWVIQAFESNPGLLQSYQEKFQYILVDEFQDTSGSQNKILELLINYWGDRPDVFVVGDDDQSIYRFQGAETENLLRFRNTYINQLNVIVPKNNYRSTQPILNLSKTIIDKNNNRLIHFINGVDKTLISTAADKKGNTNSPHIQEYETVADEMAGIAKSIKMLLDAGTQPGRIAVIYKENSYGIELASYCRAYEIPVYSKRSLNILEQPFIKKMVTILRYLQAELDIPYSGDELLFEILHYDFYNIAPIHIARLVTEANSRENRSSLRQLLVEKSLATQKDLFDTGIHIQLKDVSAIYEGLIKEAVNISLQNLVDIIIKKAGVLPYIMQHRHRLEYMQLLIGFFNFVKIETARNPLLSLQELLTNLDMMVKEGIPIPLVQVEGRDTSVNLLTAHGSKGLEFEHVFIAGCTAGLWEKKRRPGGGFKLPATIFAKGKKENEKQADQEEVRRLFYVALTRAETYLTLSYATHTNDGKETEPSVYISEIIDSHDIQPQVVKVSAEERYENQLQVLASQTVTITLPEADFVEELLARFVMNVTALNNYLHCPLNFYYNNLLRIPSGKNENTAFGSAIHYALEQLFRNMQDAADKTFPTKEVFMQYFMWYMKRNRECFTHESFARRMEYGQILLPAYYDSHIHNWSKIVAIERNIRGVVLRGVPLRGKLDKLEFDGNEVVVVDYKTGNYDYAVDKMKPPTDNDPNGGDYWRQAVFYKILVDEYEQKKWRVRATAFDYIEPDKKGYYHTDYINITARDIEIVSEQIETIWKKIKAHEFYTGCGKPDCHWCNFARDNKLGDVLTEDEQDEI